MNDKIKAQFFAQYLGQKVLSLDSINQHILSVIPADLSVKTILTKGVLLLREVDQLTDEEIINVAELNGYHLEDWGRDIQTGYDCITRGNSAISNLLHGAGLMGYRATIIYSYLLRIGILLSFTYLNDENKPITLPTDEIISLGWAKIKEA